MTLLCCTLCFGAVVSHDDPNFILPQYSRNARAKFVFDGRSVICTPLIRGTEGWSFRLPNALSATTGTTYSELAAGENVVLLLYLSTKDRVPWRKRVVPRPFKAEVATDLLALDAVTGQYRWNLTGVAGLGANVIRAVGRRVSYICAFYRILVVDNRNGEILRDIPISESNRSFYRKGEFYIAYGWTGYIMELDTGRPLKKFSVDLRDSEERIAKKIVIMLDSLRRSRRLP